MNRELMMHVRNLHREAIMQQQQQHLQRLGLPDPDAASLRAIEDKDEALKKKLEDAAAKQGEFLEHMALTVELREEDSGEHAFRVAMWAHLLALEHGIDPDEAQRIELAARLHDIGKVVIPDSVIRKRTALSQGERQLVETHAATGADFLIRAKVPYAALAEEIARYHHEAWSGEGYPDGISGDAIPLAARIVGLCDAFDALVHERPWRSAWRIEETLGHLVRESGRQFDPTLVEEFIPLVRRIYATHDDVDAYLAQSAQQTPLWTMRRSLVERLSRPVGGEQGADQRRPNAAACAAPSGRASASAADRASRRSTPLRAVRRPGSGRSRRPSRAASRDRRRSRCGSRCGSGPRGRRRRARARAATSAALSSHISGVSTVKRWSMPSDSAICIALSVSSRQSG